MCRNTHVPITLTIDDTPMTLPVIGFNGHDALNQPYRFDVDVLSDNPLLDFNQLLQRRAFLSLGDGEEGVHGHICAVGQGYAGTDLSHYRISLMPDLQRLDQRRQRRVLRDLSVPQLIVQLLAEHGLEEDTYRFEPATGLYPPRPLCVQHDESDLHLLQRLCEEEGIHFRFEHSRSQHLLIFSDDPGSFPPLLQPLRFQRPQSVSSAPGGLSHLRETFWALPGQGRPPVLQEESDAPEPTGPPILGVANQPYLHPAYDNRNDPRQLRQRQASRRALERMRCERYRVEGRSDRPSPGSGHVIQVLGHPIAQYNDQWLLTEVRHSAWQPWVLDGGDGYDKTRILDSTTPATAQPGYANTFAAIPWAMPFRPPLDHPKPQVHGVLPATLLTSPDGLLVTDTQGRLPIRYDWQASDATDSTGIAAHIADSELLCEGAGTAVWVGHFDNDPERPVICGLRQAEQGMRAQVDEIELAPQLTALHLKHGQRLLIEAPRLQLSGKGARLELSADGITLTARRTAAFANPRKAARHDLRLTEKPGLSGRPLARRSWYIVRMPQPDLGHLARLDPRHLLFEGKTDDQGYLGLSPQQQRQLAEEYRKTPQQLCLIHPGHCVPLEVYFQQNWSRHQLMLFNSP
ncbi:type VI secretion system Vgr family protein [Pseudomonas sp. Pseusp122]|uniref:type VI secretion system Vgr family protein n=1 Tax=unclassified Pseudomonas TaxID=196821 RepID=UPI0039A74AB6